MARKLTQKQFLTKARKLHGTKYDYRNAVYVKSSVDVEILCPVHGSFLQTAGEHLRGRGCPRCARELRRGTSEEFVIKATDLHGGRYEYSKVSYVKNSVNVEIICPDHGSFSQSPNSHLNGRGCPHCGLESRADSRRYTKERFIEDARSVHGDRYDYTEVDYKNADAAVKIFCQKHGSFLQRAIGHLKGNGCPKCSGHNKGTEQFIKEAEEVHGDRYDYGKVEYKKSKIHVEIICRKHGPFQQQPNKHLSGQGCPECGKEVAATCQLASVQEFIERAREVHGERYEYKKVRYKGANTKVEIFCPRHGTFLQTPGSHLYGRGCRKCFDDQVGDLTRSTTEEFAKKATELHGDKYDYSCVKYVNRNVDVEIICPEHGMFLQTPGSHLGGHACPGCGLPSDMDVLYVWRLVEYPEQNGRRCYKVGLTSVRLGAQRIREVERASGFTAVDIRLFKCDRAAKTETALLKIGETAQLSGFTGATECRLFGPEEYEEAISICMAAGTEIKIPS